MVAALTIAFVSGETDTGNAVGEPMGSSAAATPRHRLATIWTVNAACR
jgi:phosphate/sulfate permease